MSCWYSLDSALAEHSQMSTHLLGFQLFFKFFFAFFCIGKINSQGPTLRLALLPGASSTVKNMVSGKFMVYSKSPNRQVNIPTLIPHTKVRPRLSSLFRQKNALHSDCHSKLYASIEFILIKMLKRHPK